MFLLLYVSIIDTELQIEQEKSAVKHFDFGLLKCLPDHFYHFCGNNRLITYHFVLDLRIFPRHTWFS